MLKTLDKNGRWRNLTVAFRMSPEESADLNTRVKLSGLTKQDYIMRRLSERDVVVQGNSPRVYKALRNQMTELLAQLKRLEGAGDADDDFLSVLRLVAETINAMAEESSGDKPTIS
ncbi:MAG: hypothetical protein LBB91_04410 [Clostridiales bacterium]|jgi:hypothetical protein|nr:hypothetical protein [Clostridiales bacterium]